jgi:hypothetical protein
MTSILRRHALLFGLAAFELLLSANTLTAQGMRSSVSGGARPGGSVTVAVSGVSAVSISADLNGVPLPASCYGPIRERDGKLEQVITLPNSATGTLNVQVSSSNGDVQTHSQPVSAADG